MMINSISKCIQDLEEDVKAKAAIKGNCKPQEIQYMGLRKGLVRRAGVESCRHNIEQLSSFVENTINQDVQCMYSSHLWEYFWMIFLGSLKKVV